MATERLVSAAAYGDTYDKPISGVLHHHRGHDRYRDVGAIQIYEAT